MIKSNPSTVSMAVIRLPNINCFSVSFMGFYVIKFIIEDTAALNPGPVPLNTTDP